MNSANNNSWIDELRCTERLPANYAAMALEYVIPLAERIRALHAFIGRPVVIGINGAQGCGKTTFSLFLANWLEREIGLASVTLSLDDLYLARQARENLAERHHPLLRTRGVPGTHDVALGIRILDALTGRSNARAVKLPLFDKATDDVLHESEWPSVAAPVAVVLFEGWCVAARPQSAESLDKPINSLEAEEDADGAWRKYVNEKLRFEYAELFARIDALIMLRSASFDNVYSWRALQEQKLRDASGSGMSPGELRRFIMHFERLTRHMLDCMPDQANTLIDVDESQQMVGMTHGDWPCAPAPS